MTEKYCNVCDEVACFGRDITLLTILLILFSHGWWLLAVFLFYEKKCKTCGTDESDAALPQENKTSAMLIGICIFCLAAFITSGVAWLVRN